MTLTFLLISFNVICFAPKYSLEKVYVEPINEEMLLYENIWHAVCVIESSGNPLAYNLEENAVGISQIRQIRIDDYNNRTGKNYQLIEMYDPVKSKEVFMYFANLLKDPDLIIRKWNGSGPMTYVYLKKVQNVLDTIMT